MPQPVSAIDSRITGLSAMQLGAARPVEIVHTPTLILPTPLPIASALVTKLTTT